MERLERVAEGDEEKPAYVTHDIRAQWAPASWQDLTVTLAVNNVFDKRYSDHSSYLSAAVTACWSRAVTPAWVPATASDPVPDFTIS